MEKQQNGKYIPLNANESAVLNDANTLLPRDEIYEPLVEFIRQARDNAADVKVKSLNEMRSHNAISIDGARGTGKTAVQVNLKRYIELENPQLLSDVHILEPIDPTLLEDGESIFLHIIVASVLHDSRIKQAQRDKPALSTQLNQALNELAHALEVVETQKDRHGLDKVRAMYGNKHLADSVHEFFYEAVQLLGIKLLVLPIDDVDTSLNLAFENLEIIRRYLTTPYVLPIVSGDRSLYQEVTWRDFHGRLIKDSDYLKESAYKTALELSEEYQRKVLPFPRRLSMPDVSNYWQWSYLFGGKAVSLGNTQGAIPLPNFVSWLDAFLTGSVNGQENSRIPIPIPSIRALVQLVGHCRDFIPALPDAIRTAKSDLEVRRAWQMPNVPLGAITKFQNKHQELSKEKKREYAEAYKEFADEMDKFLSTNASRGSQVVENKRELKTNSEIAYKLAEYFRFEPKAGTIYLLLIAKMHWQDWGNSSPLVRQRSIFDTPLFQPLSHNDAPNLNVFDKIADLSEWPDSLNERLPQAWLDGLRSYKTILPYPVPEVGVNSGKEWNYTAEISSFELAGLNQEQKSKASFLITMLAQRNFYTNAKETILLNIGRIFELIIASIVGPVKQEDLIAMMNRAPFFSTQELAPTKTLLLVSRGVTDETTSKENIETDQELEFEPIAKLYYEINKWRTDHKVHQIELSPWLVYKVFNKVYSQVASSDLIPNGMQNVGAALNIAAHTFYATWSAFGSFEKGVLFGLPNVVATTNLNAERLKGFENHDHFKVNIGPFTPTRAQIENKGESYETRKSFGEHTRTISYILAHHPLKKWIDEVIDINWPTQETIYKGSSRKTKQSQQVGSKVWLCNKIDISPVPDRLTQSAIAGALEGKNTVECRKLLNEMTEIYPANDLVLKNLKKIIESKLDKLA